MATAIINGRQVVLPDSASDAEIRRAGSIDPKRNLMRRTREGNFIVPKGSRVGVGDGDVFIDAPARIKGTGESFVTSFSQRLRSLLEDRDAKSDAAVRPPGRHSAFAADDRRSRIFNEVIMTAPRFADRGGVDFDEEHADWLRIRRFALPDRWGERWAQLLIIFPQTYPTSPPLGFYLDRQFPLAGGSTDPHLTGTAYHGAPDLLAQGWFWYCVQPLGAPEGGWRPSDDYQQPDNLWTILTLVRDVLSNDA